jgi:hypothetical protein
MARSYENVLLERWLKFYPNSKVSDIDLLIDTVKVVNKTRLQEFVDSVSIPCPVSLHDVKAEVEIPYKFLAENTYTISYMWNHAVKETYKYMRNHLGYKNHV